MRDDSEAFDNIGNSDADVGGGGGVDGRERERKGRGEVNIVGVGMKGRWERAWEGGCPALCPHPPMSWRRVTMRGCDPSESVTGVISHNNGEGDNVQGDIPRRTNPPTSPNSTNTPPLIYV